MITVELSFTATEARLSARPAHRAVLQRLHHQGILVGAGPWADDSGALLIFDTDRPAVDDLLATDPYYRTDDVEVTAVRAWTPVVAPSTADRSSR